MGEYEELMKEKRRIEQRLRELKNQTITVGRARLDRRRFYGREAEYSYNICVKKHSGVIESESRKWYSIVEDFDKDKAIEVLDEILGDLETLRDKMLRDKE